MSMEQVGNYYDFRIRDIFVIKHILEKYAFLTRNITDGLSTKLNEKKNAILFINFY